MAIRNASNWEQCTKEGASIWNSNSLRTSGALAAWAVQSSRPPPPPVSLLMRTLSCPLSYCVVQTHLIFRSLSLFSLSRFFRISMNWLKKCSWSFRFWTSRNLWSRPYFSANSLNVVLKDKGSSETSSQKRRRVFPQQDKRAPWDRTPAGQQAERDWVLISLPRTSLASGALSPDAVVVMHASALSALTELPPTMGHHTYLYCVTKPPPPLLLVGTHSSLGALVFFGKLVSSRDSESDEALFLVP